MEQEALKAMRDYGEAIYRKSSKRTALAAHVQALAVRLWKEERELDRKASSPS